MFSELFQLLNIKKTRTTPYIQQCDGQLEKMNSTMIELQAVNVTNTTHNWDINVGFVLIPVWKAMKFSTDITLYYMLFVR